MRIIVISDLPQFVTGGAEMQASRLIEAWADMGHEVICFGRRVGARSVTLGKHSIPTFRVHTAQSLGRPVRALTYFLSLTWLLLRHRRWADVIYCRFLGDAAATVAICKKVGFLRIPLIPTPANAGLDGDVSYIRSVPGSDWLIRQLDEQCDAINLIAPQMEQDLRAAGFKRARFSKIPNGIPVRAMEKMERKGVIRAVSVGRLSNQKGYDLLIDALASRQELADYLKIDVIGDGPELAALQARASRLKHGLITFRGEIEPALVRAELLAADLFILPSRYEGMSNAVLEAMECGLPLVITQCGGIDTYVTPEMGWTTPAGDAAKFVAALADACSRPREELLQMGASSRALVQREFAMSGVARRYLELFEALIK